MEKTTNVRVVIDKIKRHPLLQDVPFETIIDYLVDFLQIVGCPELFEEKTAVIKIKDNRGLLPCDYVSMIQVRPNHNCEHRFRSGDTYRYATDSFHMSPEEFNSALTYKIQGSVIYTSTRNTDIEIAYHAIAVDNEGFPLIPDNPSFTRAFNAYVKKQHFTVLFDLGKIQPAVYNQALQDYAFYVGDCESEFHRLTLDKAEALYNSWRTLLIRDTEHRSGFRNNGDKEYLRRH